MVTFVLWSPPPCGHVIRTNTNFSGNFSVSDLIFVSTIHILKHLIRHIQYPNKNMGHRTYSAEETYSFLASEEANDETTFRLLSASSSNTDEPRRSQCRTPTAAAPESSDPMRTTPENYIPQVYRNPGIQFNVAGFRELDFKVLFFSDDLVTLMVTQTNLYAEQFIAQNPTSTYAQPHRWTLVHAKEMVKFWGLVLHMGLVKKPSIRSYWSTDILYHTPMFRMAKSRTHFEAILRFLHYSDNAQCPPHVHSNYDRLYKLRPLIDHFSAKFSQAYTPPEVHIHR